MGLNILVYGEKQFGAREDAIVQKLMKEKEVSKIFVYPGNGGSQDFEQLDFNLERPLTLAVAARKRKIDLVVVGPEAPLARGVADQLRSRGVPVFGPGALGAQIETSKAFFQNLVDEWLIPAAKGWICNTPEEADTVIDELPAPYVIKADGLAGGKGVEIHDTRKDAKEAACEMLSGRRFGDSGKTIVIQEFLSGLEVSLMVAFDTQTGAAIPFQPVCDYKRARNGDRGPNTGGMGGYTRPGQCENDWLPSIMKTHVRPLMDAFRHQGIHYHGIVFFGFILTANGPKLLELNCRFGDPETQLLMAVMKSSLSQIMMDTALGRLNPNTTIEWDDCFAVAITLATRGYPENPEHGHPIHLPEKERGHKYLHAGTTIKDGILVSSGGRVLTAVGTGINLRNARSQAYYAAHAVRFEGKWFRDDIADREIFH